MSSVGQKAKFPLPPPIQKQAVGFVKDDQVFFNGIGIRMLTDLWAGIQGEGGVKPQADSNTNDISSVAALVAIIFAMSGDGTLSADGELTVVSSEGRVFVQSAFTDTTDATNITSGTLAFARLPFTIGEGLVIDSGALETEDSEVTPVSGLPAQPYRMGARRFVNDSTVAASGNFGAIVAGGAGNPVPVFSDGANWLIG